MWIGLFAIGSLAGFLAWYGAFLSIPVIVFYVVVVAIDTHARSRSGAGLVGFGLTLALLSLYEGTRCPDVIRRIEGGFVRCEPGRDLRFVLVLALVLSIWGATLSYRQIHRADDR